MTETANIGSLVQKEEIVPTNHDTQYAQDIVSGVKSGIKSALYTPFLYNWVKELITHSFSEDNPIKTSTSKQLAHGLSQIVTSCVPFIGLCELANHYGISDSKLLGILIPTLAVTNMIGFVANEYRGSSGSFKPIYDTDSKL